MILCAFVINPDLQGTRVEVQSRSEAETAWGWIWLSLLKHRYGNNGSLSRTVGDEAVERSHSGKK